MKKKILIGCLITVLVGGFIAVGLYKNSNTSTLFRSENTVDVKVSKVTSGSISESVAASGIVEDVDSKDMSVDVSIKVKSIKVTQYQKVTKGQQLIELDTDALKNTMLNANKKIKEIKNLCLSPMDGIVTEINVKQDGTTSSMQPMMRIVNTDKLQIKAKVKEKDLAKVAEGQQVKITSDALDAEKTISGTVVSIAPIATRSQTMSGEEAMVETVISMQNTDKIIRPGLSVNCEIITNIKNNAVLVSFDMLKEDKDGQKLVYVVSTPDNVIHEKQLKTGLTSDLNVEAIDGVKDGDLVVVNPLPSVKDGVKAKIISN